MTYKISIPGSYWGLNIDGVNDLYGDDVVYMGYFAIKTKNGNWSDSPVDVFYQPNPKTELGHSHYFGFFIRDDSAFVTDAQSAFENPLIAALSNDFLYISRYRNHFLEFPGGFIDGGRDYTRLGGIPIPKTVEVVVKGPDFYVGEEKAEKW